MKIAVSILVILFGLLSAAAPAVQLRNQERRIANYIMLLGGILLAAGGVCKLAAPAPALPLAIVGAVAVCGAAIANGLKNGKVHILHHVIRIAVSILLIVGLALL